MRAHTFSSTLAKTLGNPTWKIHHLLIKHLQLLKADPCILPLPQEGRKPEQKVLRQKLCWDSAAVTSSSLPSLNSSSKSDFPFPTKFHNPMFSLWLSPSTSRSRMVLLPFPEASSSPHQKAKEEITLPLYTEYLSRSRQEVWFAELPLHPVPFPMQAG